MAYDEKLAERVSKLLASESNVTPKKMFGGVCMMVSGHMCCGILNDTLMARVGPDQYEECLEKDHASPMDFTGRPMKGMVYVSGRGIETDDDLSMWINRCLKFVKSLAPKK